jgi:hypothetical protein
VLGEPVPPAGDRVRRDPLVAGDRCQGTTTAGRQHHPGSLRQALLGRGRSNHPFKLDLLLGGDLQWCQHAHRGVLLGRERVSTANQNHATRKNH